MGDKSKIEWTDATWNPILGCSKVSPGCKNCYAIRTAYRLQHNPNPIVAKAFEGLTKIEGGKPNWTGRVNFVADRLDQPLHWKQPRRIFVNSQSDLFHESLSEEHIQQIFNVMCESKQHVFQVLTKRPERMKSFLSRWNSMARDFGPLWPHVWPQRHIWLGVSVENPDYLTRLDHLRDTPAALRWCSFEPLLADLGDIRGRLRYIQWAVGGFESGPKARPGHPKWARNLRDQSLEVGTAFFWKQNGEWIPDDDRVIKVPFEFVSFDGTRWNTVGKDRQRMLRVGKKAAGRRLDGREWNEYPEVRP